jgi:hypothetical protein
MTDQDLLQVRALRAHLDRPRPGALDRARARAVAGDPARPRRRVRARLLPVLAVGAAVAVTAVGVVAVITPRGRPTPAPTVAPATVAPSLSVSPSPTAPTLAQVIDDLAARAAAGPPAGPIRPDQYVRSTLRFQQEGKWYTDDMWLRPQGMIIVRVQHHFPDGHTEDNNFGSFVTSQQREFDDHGANMRRPTPTWLAALDTDTDALRDALGADPACPPGGCDKDGLDRIVWIQVGDLVRQTDVVMTPRLRAAMLRVLGAISNAAPQQVTIEGRRYWAISLTSEDATYRDAFLVDPTTGRIAGDTRFMLKTMIMPTACATMGKRGEACKRALENPEYIFEPHPDRPAGVSLWSTRVDNDTR